MCLRSNLLLQWALVMVKRSVSTTWCWPLVVLLSGELQQRPTQNWSLLSKVALWIVEWLVESGYHGFMVAHFHDHSSLPVFVSLAQNSTTCVLQLEPLLVDPSSSF